jgi:DNA-binding response OmpR family regulator
VAQILVVEDEPAIAESIAYSLGKGGHESRVATSLRAARESLEQPCDLLVLDLMLPDGSGFDLISELAEKRKAGLAVIVLSSRDGEGDRVRALEMGADDYVTKPFSPREVVARVTAILRRLPPNRSVDERGGKPRLLLSHDKRRVSVGDEAIELTRVEFDLLGLLHSDPGHVFSRAVIIDRVWGEGFALSDRTIDSHIKALRKKLGDCGGSGEWIETVRGIGYRLSEEGPSP